MYVLMFIVGFMLCGFIMYGIFTHVAWKALRGEDICGVKIDFNFDRSVRTPYTYRELYTSYSKINYNPVFISSEADGIIDIFEEFLTKYGIQIPCEDETEEKEREEGGNAAIYGMAYGDLQTEVEEYLRGMMKQVEDRGWK